MNVHTDYSGVAVNSFKRALHLTVIAAQDHDVAGIDDIEYMDVVANPT